MDKPIVLLDCDGVLADFDTAALDVLASLCGVRYPNDAIRTWEIFDSIGHDDLRDVVYDTMGAPGFCFERIQPYPGAVDAVRELRKRADLYVVTAPFRTDHWRVDRARWLQHHFGLEVSHVLFTAHKWVVRGDLFADDKPEHVRNWDARRRRCDGKAYLWDHPSNRDVTDLPRLSGWEALLRAV